MTLYHYYSTTNTAAYCFCANSEALFHVTLATPCELVELSSLIGHERWLTEYENYA